MNKNLLIASLLAVLGASSCSKENYLYIQKQRNKTNTDFKVKEMKGSNAVDVLWVIDNSGSMGTYQQQVIQNANMFMQDFILQKLNWKMGLISTDVSELPYAGFSGSIPLDSTVNDPVAVFSGAVSRLGTNGDSEERTFSPIIQALRADPTFVRPNSPLAIIMVTDAEEQSRMSGQNFYTSLQNLVGNRGIYGYGVFAADDFNCKGEGWDYKGSPYEQFLSLVQVGQTYVLCQNFGQSLAQISKDIVTRASHTAIYLTDRPDTQTLQVLYHDQPLAPGPKEKGGYWIYDYRMNAIIFNDLEFAKNDNDSVRVVYEEAR